MLLALSVGCRKEKGNEEWISGNYPGSYKNAVYTETLIKDFTAGVYHDNEIPEDIKQLQYGRIEIDFQYYGGGLIYFMPLMYYGSVNKNDNDDDVEEPKFHIAVEIGHYNVIPFSVEYLFYTISTYRQPLYCRDSFWPVISGKTYTYVIDKKPEGIVLQLKNRENIVNVFPHAFFPDSSQLFFKDITACIDNNQGDSLQKVLMVGKGYAGIEKGIHDFNGKVTSLRVYKYTISNPDSGFELKQVGNQHSENQHIIYSAIDNLSSKENLLILKYQYYPYRFENGELIPSGSMQTGESEKTQNDQPADCYLTRDNLGFYKINISTLDKNGTVLRSTQKPFEIWVYPKEWYFEF